jgi:putative DNA primase/helicase
VLHRTFCAWAKANGEREWSQRGFSDALTERGLHKTKSDTVHWLDVKLVKQAEDFAASVMTADREGGAEDQRRS